MGSNATDTHMLGDPSGPLYPPAEGLQTPLQCDLSPLGEQQQVKARTLITLAVMEALCSWM